MLSEQAEQVLSCCTFPGERLGMRDSRAAARPAGLCVELAAIFT